MSQATYSSRYPANSNVYSNHSRYNNTKGTSGGQGPGTRGAITNIYPGTAGSIGIGSLGSEGVIDNRMFSP